MTQKKLNRKDLRIRTAGDLFHIEGKLDNISRNELMSKLAPYEETLLKQVGKRVNDGYGSIIVFRTQRKVPFIAGASSHLDDVYGYCAMYEYDGFVVITREKSTRSERDQKSWLQKLSRGEMIGYASHDAEAHESINGRPVDVGYSGIHAQRTEGEDLAASLPMTGMNRFLLSSAGIRKSGHPRIRVTLSTSAVRTPGSRVPFEDWCSWARAIIEDVISSKGSPPSAFFRRFAQPLDIRDLPDSVYPTAVFLWVESLTTPIDLSSVQFLWRSNKDEAEIEVPRTAVNSVLQSLRQPMRVANSTIIDGVLCGSKIQKNTSSFTLRVKWFKKVRVKDVETGEFQGVSEWIRQNRCLHVVFSDYTYAYSDNMLFRDSTIAASAGAVRGMIRSFDGIKEGMPEKRHGRGSNKQNPFSPDSLFRFLEDELLKSCDVLICDDDAHEWADYISISEHQQTLTLVYAKSGSGKLAPAMFEGVVSQAIKNLGRRRPTRDELEDQESRWRDDKVGLKNRVLKGKDASHAASTYLDIVSRHDCKFKIVLAVTFLSKKAVDALCNKIASDTPLGDAENILLWLLTGFMSQCQAVGAVPEVWCREE